MAAKDDTKAGKGAHDRVAMLSLKANGEPDQFDPEFLGDADAAKAEAAERAKVIRGDEK